MANDSWRATTSLPEGTPIPGNRTHGTDGHGHLLALPGDVKFDARCPDLPSTFGGPILKDHLWFFTAGRLQDQIANRQTFVTNLPYTLTNDQNRYEVNVTYSATPTTGSTAPIRTFDSTRSTAVSRTSWIWRASHGEQPAGSNHVQLQRRVSNKLYVEGRATSRHWTSEGAGSAFADPNQGHAAHRP